MITDLIGEGILLPIAVSAYEDRRSINPENTREYSNGLERDVEGSPYIPIGRSRFNEAENFNHGEFIRSARLNGVTDTYGRNTDEKRRLLTENGYTEVIGKGGKIISIYDAPDEQVGAIFHKQYQRAA